LVPFRGAIRDVGDDRGVADHDVRGRVGQSLDEAADLTELRHVDTFQP
jgi:hypothetical protein